MYKESHSSKSSKRKQIFLVSFIVIILCFLSFFIGSSISKKSVLQASNNQASKQQQNTSPTNNSNPVLTNNSNKDNKTSNNSTSSVNADKPKDISKKGQEKVVYLTFDDGPSTKVTPQLLKILDNYNVKASFFLVGRNAAMHPDLVKEQLAKGHAICNHTYSHNYSSLYSGTNNFITDVKKCDNSLKNIIGKDTNKIIRFPGGGFYKKRAAYREVAKSQGFKSIDWNVETGDARANHVPVDKLLSNLKEDMSICPKSQKNNIVVLMHDIPSKQTTADALPKVIEYFKSQGYVFKTLEEYPFDQNK